MVPNELAIVRPKPGRGRQIPIGDDRFRRAVRRSSLSWVRRAEHHRPGRLPRIEVRASREHSRRAFLKVYVAPATPQSAAALARHIRYIARDGVERDGSRGVLYGADGPALAAAVRSPRRGEKRHFRLTISPEDGYELDLRVYVRRLMAQVERDLGQRLEWAAVNHHDTGHAHAHVVVRGVDCDGFEVTLGRHYMLHGLRRRAQAIATEELGPRLPQELERRREVTEERYTSLDRELARRERDHQVNVQAGSAPRSPLGHTNGLLVARLAHLERYRLAHRQSATSWLLTPKWAETLQDIEARGQIVEQIHQALRGDPARYRIVFPGQKLEPMPTDGGPVLTGRVVRTGPWDQRRGNFYVDLETPAGSGYRLSLDARSAEGLRAGDLACFATRPERARRRGMTRHYLAVRRLGLELEEQVFYRGPVWLDTLRGTPLAVYGFGAEVRRAMERRDGELCAIGIDPVDCSRIGRLQELERRDVGREIAARTGKTFLGETAGVFRGRIELAGNRSIRPLAIVSDRSRFVLVPATRELRVRLGRDVTFEPHFEVDRGTTLESRFDLGRASTPERARTRALAVDLDPHRIDPLRPMTPGRSVDRTMRRLAIDREVDAPELHAG